MMRARASSAVPLVDSETESGDGPLTDDSDEDEDEEGPVFKVHSDEGRVESTISEMELYAKHLVDSGERRAWQSNLYLAVSVAFWVALFGLFVYDVGLNDLLFGQRGAHIEALQQSLNQTNTSHRHVQVRLKQLELTCSDMDVGMMRNVAEAGEYPRLMPWNASMSPWHRGSNESDVWCGYLPTSYAKRLPNIASFIYCTVFKTTGSTVEKAVYGMSGVVLAGLNMHVMKKIFPFGARGFKCVDDGTGGSRLAFNHFTVVALGTHGEWRVYHAERWSQAVSLFKYADRGGILGRALFQGDKVVQYMAWFANDEVRDKVMAKFKESSHPGTSCKVGTMTYDDPNWATYGEPVCLLNVFIVFALLLFPNLPRSTALFGLSWAITWMMGFMNPAQGVAHPTFGDAEWASTEYFAVEITTFVGCLVAILTTLVPCVRMQNLRLMYKEALALTYVVADVWDRSAAYFARGVKSTARLQIESHISNFTARSGKARANLDGAWWETFDLGRRGRKRILLDEVSRTMLQFDKAKVITKAAVMGEDFQGLRGEFWATLQVELRAVVSAARSLAFMSLRCCRDGMIDNRESEQLKAQVDLSKQARAQLHEKFRSSDLGLTRDLAEPYFFLYGLASWTRVLENFAVSIAEKAHVGHSYGRRRLWLDRLKGVFTPNALHVKWAIRNLCSLYACFLIGYFVSGSIFSRYDGTMANTLAMLMVAESAHSVEYEKCARRLVAVSMGKSLPFLMLSLLGYFPCGSIWRTAFQGLAVFIYVFVWTFCWYNSKMWSYVSCLIGAFGISSITKACGDGGTEATFASQYREIGNVTVAILLQAVLHTALSRYTPRQLLQQSFERLQQHLTASLEGVFAGDFAAVAASTEALKAELATAMALADECDPKVELVQGPQGSFKISLCRDTLSSYETMQKKLVAFVLVAKDEAPSGESDSGSVDEEVEANEAETSYVLDRLLACSSFGTLQEACCRKLQFLDVAPTLLFSSSEAIGAKAEELIELYDEELTISSTTRAIERVTQELLGDQFKPQGRRAVADFCQDPRVRMTLALHALSEVGSTLTSHVARCISEAVGE